MFLSFAYLLSGLVPRLRPSSGQKEPRIAAAGGRDGHA
jgi:hypothetical protein